MKTNKTEIRGCCMGIPFGCGSLLLLFVGAGLWRHTGVAWFLLAAFAPMAIAVVTAALYAGLRFMKTLPISRPAASR